MHFCFPEIYRESSYQSPQPQKKNSFSSDKAPNKLADKGNINGHSNGKGDARSLRKQRNYTELSSSSSEDSNDGDDRRNNTSRKKFNASSSEPIRKDGSQTPSGLRNRKGEENGLPSRTTRNSNAQVILIFASLPMIFVEVECRVFSNIA